MLPKLKIMQLRKDALNPDARLPMVFNALSDAGRYHMFKLLSQRQQLCVTDIAHIMNISVPAASQQLKLLEMSGLVRRRRHVQMICYSLQKNSSYVRSMLRLVHQEDATSQQVL